MAEVPESVAEGLRGIRSGLHLRWNPRARVVIPGGFDVHGSPTEPTYDARWELWDIDPDGRAYKVMTLQNADGSFRPPGQWLVDLVWIMNPARYGGDVSKMLRALVDDHNDKLQQVADDDFEELADAVVEWTLDMQRTQVNVLADVR